MKQLLSPAGNIESFYAAISSGADAIYLGLNKFSARAYADNFNFDNLKELIPFAHLRNVEIYVTINTIIYEHELQEAYQTIDRLAILGVDGVIVQDLALIHYVNSHYQSLKVVASTQIGIDDLEGALLMESLGVRRIVFARETPLKTLKDIKEKTNVEIEAFIHGALCVSYSGNCLFSSMIGERSGNRGRCAGCCRKLYSLIDKNHNQVVKKGYLLSLKDLNVSNQIKDMDFIDSYKIEGRMKEPHYVAGVTKLYRQLIDQHKINDQDFNKMFNRTYTKGFINEEKIENIANHQKPNNYGYLIGHVERCDKNKIGISLFDTLNKGDQIRIESENEFEEISVPILKMFDQKGNEVKSADRYASTFCSNNVKIGAKVYKTKDLDFINRTKADCLQKQYQKLPLFMEFKAIVNQRMVLKIKYQNHEVEVFSETIVEKSKTAAITRQNIIQQLNKLHDTPYFLEDISIEMDDDIFISLKNINILRREAIAKLNSLRLTREIVYAQKTPLKVKNHISHQPILTVEVSNDEQYNIAKEMGVENIYYQNIVRKNHATYKKIDGEVLIGGLGGIQHYRSSNMIVSDYSMNVTNSQSVALLSTLGVERITLSQEVNINSVNDLIKQYISDYHTHPNLEMIIYGRTKLMHTKYCVLKSLNLCGKCKNNHYVLKDDYASFPLLFNDDCTNYILNAKCLNLIDEIDNINNINYYRLVFTTENAEQVKLTIKRFQEKMNGLNTRSSFNKKEQTHGHFFDNPL